MPAGSLDRFGYNDGQAAQRLVSQKLTFAPRLDASIAALVRVAAARRGRTRKCDIGIGTGGGNVYP